MSYWLDYCKYYWDPSRYLFTQIQLMPDHKPSIKHQRRLNLPMQEVVKREIIKCSDAEFIYPVTIVVGYALFSVC